MKPSPDAGLRWLRYPDVLAPPAVPFESYTKEQGGKAVQVAKTIVALVRQKLRPRKKG